MKKEMCSGEWQNPDNERDSSRMHLSTTLWMDFGNES